MSEQGSPPPTTVFVDADNTLWDTDRVFADAQLGLLSDVETGTTTTCTASDRLGYIRALDIAPAKEAGLATIYFPGGFRPEWAPDEAAVQPDFKVTDFTQAVQIILTGKV